MPQTSPPQRPNALEMSYAGAETMAAQYPQYATQITAAAKTSFLAGDQYAYIAGIVAVLGGAALVFFMFPKKDARAEDARRVPRPGPRFSRRGKRLVQDLAPPTEGPCDEHDLELTVEPGQGDCTKMPTLRAVVGAD